MIGDEDPETDLDYLPFGNGALSWVSCATSTKKGYTL